MLEKAIGAVTQECVRVIGSGRTDAGAHACGQVVAFDTQSSLSPQSLCRAINAHLPGDVRVISAREAAAEFHPRFDARSRVYRYVIWNREIASPFWADRAAHVKWRLDVQAMDRAARELVGVHDFSAFVAAGDEGNRQRRMYSARCWREGDLVIVELEASGFMRQMARAIAGTLIRAGSGRLTAEGMREILLSRRRDRAGETAPARGLYLADVRYPETGEEMAGPQCVSVGEAPSGLPLQPAVAGSEIPQEML